MTDQKSKWHKTRKARMDELFAGKRFEVVAPFDFEEPVETPLGYKVSKGYNLISTDGTMNIYVGKALMTQLAEEYNAVDKPAARKRGRPRKQANPNADEHFEG